MVNSNYANQELRTLIQALIANTVCSAPIVAGSTSGQGTDMVTIEVAKATTLGGAKHAGQTVMQLNMVGRTAIRVKSNQPVEVFCSYTHDRPSAAIFDYHFNISANQTNQHITIRYGESLYWLSHITFKASFKFGGRQCVM